MRSRSISSFECPFISSVTIDAILANLALIPNEIKQGRQSEEMLFMIIVSAIMSHEGTNKNTRLGRVIRFFYNRCVLNFVDKTILPCRASGSRVFVVSGLSREGADKR